MKLSWFVAVCIGAAAPVGAMDPRLSASAIDPKLISATSHRLAKCVVDRDVDVAKKMVGQVSRSTYASTVNIFLSLLSLCQGSGKAVIVPQIVTGWLAEELIMLNHRVPVDRGSNFKPKYMVVYDSLDLYSKEIACLVKDEPEKVADLFLTKPYSSAEAGVLNKLSPAYVNCGAPESGIDFDKISLTRAAMARAYYNFAVVNEARNAQG